MSEALLIKLRPIVLWFTALSFITVGVMHFTHEYIFLPMMPDFLPYHLELVWLSGGFEILGGLGILVPQTRRFSAWGLLALLVAVFPANINMALNGISGAGFACHFSSCLPRRFTTSGSGDQNRRQRPTR